MSDRSIRRPATFKLDDPRVVVMDADDEAPRPARGAVRITPEPEIALPPAIIEETVLPAERKLRWGSVLGAATAGLVILAAGFGVTNFLEDLFARSETLGLIGATLTGVACVALLAIIVREAVGLARLATIENLHRRAAQVMISDDRSEANAIVRELMQVAHRNPRLAHARAMMDSHRDDIIDGADLIRLAERELLSRADEEARRLVSIAAQRVSIVTAISPRALVDVLFVLAAALRLVRQLARLYGGRPGTLGMIKLMRQTVAHLAITGGLAASDSLIQQMLGHGVAAKVSSRLGEGVLNGLLTARLGLAAIDVTRPLPFAALPRPLLGDLAKDLLRKREE